MSTSKKLVVLAAGAHPDDIEIMMAGTLMLFKEAGAEIHMLNVLNGSCGTAEYSRKDIIRIRWKEAREAAEMIGATIHPPLFDDLGVFYDAKSQARVAARIREIKPDVVLTQSPEDYMEDHMITVRHIVTGFFCKGMRNLPTNPKRKPYQTDGVLYHALPHGLRDGLGRIVPSEYFVDVSAQMKTKRAMLACHRSQKNWLDVSQGMDSYLNEMESIGAKMGKLSGKFRFAEGWRKHSHLGFGPADFDPLQDFLKEKCFIDPRYAAEQNRYYPNV